MHFDDRLATVLQHRAAGERAARVQFRQLLDLLGEAGVEGDPDLARAAYRRLDSLALALPADQRERLAGECSPRIRNPRLLAWFAGAEPRITLAALSRASLDERQWLALIPELPIRSRGILRHRRNLPRSALDLLDRLGVVDRVLPEPPIDAQAGVDPLLEIGAAGKAALDLGRYAGEDHVLEPAGPESGQSRRDQAGRVGNLGALVRRIEEFQRTRDQRVRDGAAAEPSQAGSGDVATSPRPELAGFLFTTDEDGRVDWAEGAAAPLVVGTSFAFPGGGGSNSLARAFATRRPVEGAVQRIGGSEVLAGDWIVDAAPRFAPRSGRFSGYVGRFRRPAPAPADNRASHAADRVRQLLHELRTPVSAIQGFAEVIQQQTIGPVPHEYRAIAAGIAGDAARMLAGFAEIERFARLEAGTQDLAEGTTDFAAVARRQVEQLRSVLSPRVSRIESSFSLESAMVPLGSEGAEGIAWRFLGTLASTVAAGETFGIALDAADGQLRLTARLPAAMAAVQDVFAADIHPTGGALGVGLLGAGFALRLARAESRSVGGDLLRDTPASMVLLLPLGESTPAPARGKESAPIRNDSERTGSSAPLAQSPRAR